ncbi:MAG: HlyD family efflux transporter periplasmic adaptor subunit [Bacteroidaceae bacterium]
MKNNFKYKQINKGLSLCFGMLTLIIALTSCNNNEASRTAYGQFEATEVIVSAQTSGILNTFDIDEGMEIEGGKVIGLVDTLQLYLEKAALIKQGASLLTTRPEITKQMASLKSQIVNAKKNLVRIQNLNQVEAATPQQLDDATTAVKVLENKLTALRSSLDITTSHVNAENSVIDLKVAKIQDLINKSCLTSPISGIVLAQYQEEGEWTAPGKPLFKIADMDHLYLRAYLTTSQLKDLKLNDEVTIQADYGNEDYVDYKGRIEWISTKNGFTPKNIQTADSQASLVYAVKIAIENDGRIKLGMSGIVKF